MRRWSLAVSFALSIVLAAATAGAALADGGGLIFPK
jgi:hypothetical protein